MFQRQKSSKKKRRGAENQDGQVKEITIIQEKSLEDIVDMANNNATEEINVPDSLENEISLNYVISEKIWNHDKVIIDDAFVYNLALEIMDENGDQEPRSAEECKERKDWPKWNNAIQAQLNSS